VVALVTNDAIVAVEGHRANRANDSALVAEYAKIRVKRHFGLEQIHLHATGPSEKMCRPIRSIPGYAGR
jgi:hypothetical protein